MFAINQAGQPVINPLDLRVKGQKLSLAIYFLTSTYVPQHIYAGLCKHIWTNTINMSNDGAESRTWFS